MSALISPTKLDKIENCYAEVLLIPVGSSSAQWLGGIEGGFAARPRSNPCNPGSNDTVRVNGHVTILSSQELDQLDVQLSINNPDDNSIKLQGILVEVDEAYTHCPRALKFAELWNIESIQKQQGASQRRR